jgi:hypothetical protein
MRLRTFTPSIRKAGIFPVSSPGFSSGRRQSGVRGCQARLRPPPNERRHSSVCISCRFRKDRSDCAAHRLNQVAADEPTSGMRSVSKPCVFADGWRSEKTSCGDFTIACTRCAKGFRVCELAFPQAGGRAGPAPITRPTRRRTGTRRRSGRRPGLPATGRCRAQIRSLH